MSWPSKLKGQLRECAIAWAERTSSEYYESLGSPSTILFAQGASKVPCGNFFGEVWDAIRANPDWSKRLGKVHSQRKSLPEARRQEAKELHSSNSSDALLMNVFCYPGASRRMAIALGAQPVNAAPLFGFYPRLRLADGSPEATEIDMLLGDTLVEAKLTEANFTLRKKPHVERYAGLTEVFEKDFLPQNDDSFIGYQLIRNVLAAAQHDLRLVVIIDGRRPDLLQEWWEVHSAIRSAELRRRCGLHFWQELADSAGSQHARLLHEKYGL